MNPLISVFIFFNSGLQESKGQNILDMNTDLPVHNFMLLCIVFIT